ncbi:myosin-2 heavy chain-like [Rhopilema esculentum]|uniref:myosin-2 heavy chain-like n=1 Tax=Rhopilema esculentum TaxID=499914 RepID=UPI0031E1BB16|eukprot:gene8102-14018_t
MEEKLESSSFLSLLGADSGLTLINTDALVRKTELQQRKLQCKEQEIEELKERLEHLEDVVEKYASQLESLQKTNEPSQTNWTKNLIEENGVMRERLDLLFGEKQQLAKECSMLECCLEDMEQELTMLKERMDQLKKNRFEISFQELQESCQFIKDLEDENIRMKEETKLLSVENEELANECLALAQGMEAKTKEVMILEERIESLESRRQDLEESKKDGMNEEEYVKLKEEIKLLSVENEELANECLVLAQSMEAKAKEVMVLEERIKSLESESQDQEESKKDGMNEEEYVKLKEEKKLLSVENEELANECLVLAQSMEAKTKEVMILEERIKSLESESQDLEEGKKDGMNEEVIVSDGEEVETQSNQEGMKQDSDGEFIVVDDESEDGVDVSDGKLTFKEHDDNGTMQQQSEEPMAVGKILPGRMTNIQQYFDQVAELQLLKGFLSKIGSHFKIDNGIALQKVLDHIEIKIVDLIDEKKHLDEETNELRSLVEFLEFERKFTLEDFKESEEKNVELQNKLQQAVKNEIDAQSQLEAWSNCCGKLYKIIKSNEGKEKGESSMQRGNARATELARRKRFRQKYKMINANLKAYKAKSARIRRCMDALAGKNLELELKADLLQADNEHIIRERDEFEKAYKEEMQADIRMQHDLEEYKEQAKKLNIFRSALKDHRKEIDALRLERCFVLDELNMERQLHEDIERKFQMALIGKELIQRRLQQESEKCKDVERKLSEVETEKTKLQEQFDKDWRTVTEDLFVLRETNNETVKDLDGEMKIRLVYERKLEEYFAEKQRLEKCLEDEVKRNLEAENIISALHQIVEKRSEKPKRSRLSRLFRRGSD